MLTWATVLLSLLAGGAFAAFLLESREQASWHQRVAEAARGAASDIRIFLEHAIDDVRALDLLGSETLTLNPELANVILRQHETFLEVSYLEADGSQIAGASLDEPILGSSSAGSAPEWFEAARQGQMYYGELEISSDGKPFVVIAGPASTGRVIAARVQMTLLQELIEGLASPVEQTFVVDRQGRILAHVDPARVGSITVQAIPSLARLTKATSETFLGDCEDLQERPALCGASPIPETQWVLITTIPLSQAYAPLLRTLASMAAVLLVLALAAGLVTWWRLSGLVFRPLRELQEAAERFGRGDLEHKAVSMRRDEIGRVADTMNEMAARLKAQRSAIAAHTTQLESLYRVSLSLTKRLEVESVLDAVVNAAFELMPNLLDAHIFVYADDRLTLAAARRGRMAAAAAAPEPRRQGSTYTVARTGEMILLPDVRADPNYPGDPRGWPGALACVPLKVGLRVVGVLNAAYEEPHAFGQEETKLLLLLADQAAIAFENARLFGMAQQELLERRRAEQALQKANESLERKVAGRTHALLEANQRLETLKEIDRAILAARSMGEIADAGLSRLRALVRCEHADLVLFDTGRGEVRLLAVDGSPISGFKVGTVISLDDYGPIDDLQAGEVRRVDDLSVLPVLTPLRKQLLEAGILSFLTVPLVADGELIGEINLDSSRRSAFDMDAELLGREVGYQLAVALRQAVLRVALETEQQRLGRLVENLPQGVALLDAEKRVVLANPLAREYLPDLARWPSTATLQQVGGRPLERLLVSASQPGWHEVRLDAGARKMFEVAALRLGEGEETVGWIVQIRDVTSERSAQVQQRSQERLAAVGQLAAGLAHDFNNIMSVIILYAEMLLQSPGRNAQDVERLRTITQQGQRAAQLIQQILDFSRKSVMEQHPFDLVPFLREMEGLLTRTLPETIRVRVVTEGESFMLYGDPARIRQVCINLALNAREAMPDGGELRFTLSPFTLREGEPAPCVDMGLGAWIRMTVTDSGPGIKPDVMPHIFEPFFTTKSPAQASGLGLAQVYGIVQQHHGHIDVVSPKDGGTTFSVYWPAHAAAVAPVVPAEDDDAGRGSGETILVVEDNEATRASVSEILIALGYRVLQASDGRQALEVHAREAGRIDLVLSDLVMPGMGGSELVRALEAKAPEQRILLMTGYPLGGTRELLESGKVHWLQKPLTMTKLARAVREALGERPAQADAP